MCLLCVVQQWSRRVATMLPWLALPLILLWAFSQLLPPGYRFEVTSTRLACVSVLLITLFWYEILLPCLSRWRARHAARLRDARRAYTIELQKLKKMATRRCRNCLNPYKDQNPGGGRFMCSNCGHISKRPVLDIPANSPLSPRSKAGRWMCNQDWPPAAEANASWPSARYWSKDGSSLENPYLSSSAASSPWELLMSLFANIRWLCTTVFAFRFGEDRPSNSDQNTSSSVDENERNSQESRAERARRKVEEKRLARLEREMFEEEERRQREEVARLIEERRKLRGEKVEVERSMGTVSIHEKEAKKDSERGQDRRKNDRGSSKSNSDSEDLDSRRVSRVVVLKHDFDKGHTDKCESQNHRPESRKSHNVDSVHGSRSAPTKARYFGQMAGNFLSPSRGFANSSFSAVGSQGQVSLVNSLNKSGAGVFTDRSGTKTEMATAPVAMPKPSVTGYGRNPWLTNFQQTTTPGSLSTQAVLKKPWHHLFMGSLSASPHNENSEDGAPTSETKIQLEHCNLISRNAVTSPDQHGFEKSALVPPYLRSNGPFSTVSLGPFATGPLIFSKEMEQATREEEDDLFEDSCDDPDAIALLGPVSESLNCFSPEIESVCESSREFSTAVGTRFLSSDVSSKSHGFAGGFFSSNTIKESGVLKDGSILEELIKPQPVDPFVSQANEEKLVESSPVAYVDRPYTARFLESPDEHGTWQMWGTRPVGDNLQPNGNSRWFSHSMNPLGQQKALPGALPVNLGFVDLHSSEQFRSRGVGLKEDNPWLRKVSIHPLPSDGESFFSLINPTSYATCNNIMKSSAKSAGLQIVGLASANDGSKEEQLPDVSEEVADSYPPVEPEYAES